MSGYPPPPSYGGADPRWPANQPTGYDPNMPYPPYNMNQSYLTPHDPHTMYTAHAGDPYMNHGTHQFAANSNPNVGYMPAGDPRYLQSQAPYIFPQNLPNQKPAPATYHQPIDTEEVEQLSDAMDVDAREEGELSSCEGEVEQQSFNTDNRTVQPHETHEPHAQSSLSLSQDDINADLGVNGLQSTGADSIATQQGKHDHAVKGSPAKEDAHMSPITGKSPSQLRVLAQGALLNLAPHKIRYNELVQEGIDATVLKCLYDAIGIKIMAEPDNKPVSITPSATEAPLMAQKAQQPIIPSTVNGSHPIHSKPTTPANEEQATSTKKDSQDAGANSNKPMERKDVIARMLAAKAAKANSSAPTVNNTTTPGPNSGLETTSSTNMATRPLNASAAQATENTAQSTRDEVRTKEKNKAQTELARQRMEQLKKLGLGKSTPQIPGLTSTPSTVANTDGPIPTTAQEPTSLSHPLPVRPPLPGKAASTRIPGLSMTSSESSKVDEVAASDKLQNEAKEVAESSPRLHRKRPRASDFTDDLDDTPVRKHSGAGPRLASTDQRVVIDISDDEAMYGSDGDEAGVMTDTTNMSRATRSSAKPAIRDLPPLPDFPARSYGSHRSTPVPASNTPPKPANGLLKKNMEILAMRQRIAELEARRVKKQATSQNRSSESSNESAITPPDEAQQEAENSSSELENARKTLKQTVERAMSEANEPTPTISVTPIPVTSSVLSPLAQPFQSPSHPTPQRAEELRLKALRRKEIESGLPLLDAELLKTEQKLAEFREQEKKLLEQIAKGREGKRRLIEELESLGIETEGLSMAELKEISNDIESTKDIPTNEETQAMGTAIDQNNKQPEVTPPDNESKPHDTRIHDLSEKVSEPEKHAAQAEEKPSGASDSQDEMMEGTSYPEPHEVREGSYSSSAMDESMGSSEDESEEEPASVAKSTSFDSTGDEEMTTSRDPSLPVEGNVSQNDPCEPGTTYTSPNLGDNDESRVAHREPSVLSDGYEPPEPDVAMDNSSPDSPPFSPAPPEPVEQISMEAQHAPENRDTQTLTPSNQEATATAAAEPPTNDANSPSHQFTHRFSPYHSPLNLFRAYRYHPNFTDHINGGFRSLTYSHNIDPHKPLCDLEITGGVCDAPSCGFQHFQDMNLS
ncbi:hypothetical protein FQN49_001707, partial [Arthroderma sp. PD_2]